MNENKTTTYGDLKRRKQELRDEMDFVDLADLKEYRQVLQAIKATELMLLYSITPDESCGELSEQVRRRKCRTGAIVCFVIAGIAAVILVFGCHTVNGVGRDLSAWSSPYIEHQER